MKGICKRGAPPNESDGAKTEVMTRAMAIADGVGASHAGVDGEALHKATRTARDWESKFKIEHSKRIRLFLKLAASRMRMFDHFNKEPWHAGT